MSFHLYTIEIMRVSHSYIESAKTVQFRLQPEDDTPQVYHNSRTCKRLTEYMFRILLPDKIASFDSIHNDVWAFIVLLVVFPFVKSASELRLSFGVSKEFALQYQKWSKKKIVPVNPSLAPRSGKDCTHTSIAFNGRMHSFFTAAVLGSSARLVAVDHWDSVLGERTSPYPPDALYYALDNMESTGHTVAMVKTDVQSLYEPYGFVHPISSILGNVLLADVLQLTSVHMGCRLTDISAFGSYRVLPIKRNQMHRPKYKHTQHHRHIEVNSDIPLPSQSVSFRNDQLYLTPTSHLPSESTVDFWRSMLRCIGLHLEFPLCGVSDVLMVKLLIEHKMWAHANYCLYSRPKTRCHQCLECMYYDTLHTTIIAYPSINIDKIWQLFSDKYPEATTSLSEIDVPCRWTLFWLEMIRRKDMVPKRVKGFDVLVAYHPAYLMRKWMVNNMKHIVDNGQYDRIRNGLSRIVSVLK